MRKRFFRFLVAMLIFLVYYMAFGVFLGATQGMVGINSKLIFIVWFVFLGILEWAIIRKI